MSHLSGPTVLNFGHIIALLWNAGLLMMRFSWLFDERRPKTCFSNASTSLKLTRVPGSPCSCTKCMTAVHCLIPLLFELKSSPLYATGAISDQTKQNKERTLHGAEERRVARTSHEWSCRAFPYVTRVTSINNNNNIYFLYCAISMLIWSNAHYKIELYKICDETRI